MASMSTCITKLNLNENTKVKIEGLYTDNKLLMLKSDLLLTKDLKDSGKGQHQDMIVDLAVADIYVPEGDFGIKCTSEFDCTKSATIKKCGPYNGVTTDCSDSYTLMRFEEGTAAGDNNAKLSFKLFTATKQWQDTNGKTGVLGLSPSSSFWTFILNGYSTSRGKDYFDVSLNYQMKDFAEAYNLDKVIYQDSNLIVNGRESPKDIELVDSKSNTAWVIEDAKLSFWRGDMREGVSLCIDNNVNSYFMVEKSKLVEIEANMYKQLCEKDKCSRDDAAILNLDNISASYGKKTNMTFAAREYIEFVDAKDTALGFSDISESKVCSGYTYAVGRLFFTKAELTIRVKSGPTPTFKLGFAIEEKEPPKWPIMVMLSVTFILSIGIMAGLLQLCPTKKSGYLLSSQFE